MAVAVNDRVRVEPGSNGSIVVVAAWCGKCKAEAMPVGAGDCPWCGSRIVDESQLSAQAMLAQLRDRETAEHATTVIVDGDGGVERGRELLDRMDAGEPVGLEEGLDELEESASVGHGAVSGSAPAQGDPERGAASSSSRTKWTREKVIEAIREVAEKTGHTPSRKEMAEYGYGGAPQKSTTDRLGATWSDLVREAGYEPLTRASSGHRRLPPTSSEREPEASASGGQALDSEPAVSPASPLSGDKPTSRSGITPPEPAEQLLVTPDDMAPFQRALGLALIAGMRAAADALEQELAT